MRISLLPICILALGGLTQAIAQEPPRPASAALTRPSSSEERDAVRAIAAKRQALGLPLSSAPLRPRDCSVEKICPNGTRVSCSASGKFTDCGGIYNGEGTLMGVGCFAFKTANPSDGNVSVNQGSCGG